MTVWAVSYVYTAGTKTLANRRTDKQGRFSVPLQFEGKVMIHPSFIARDKQGRLGWVHATKEDQLHVIKLSETLERPIIQLISFASGIINLVTTL